MNVTYACPSCQALQRTAVDPHTEQLTCSGCGAQIRPPADAWEGQHLRRCLVCPSTDLFVRKAFPQRLGVTIVVAGFAASCVAWNFYYVYLTFGILFATALIDVVLYLVVGNLLMCYRCQAQYRGVEGLERHGGFELETHERHRQQLARIAELDQQRQRISQS